MDKKALAIVAHPDDVEFLCVESMAYLLQKDYKSLWLSRHQETADPKIRYGKIITKWTYEEASLV